MKSMTNLAHGRTRWVLIAWLFVLSALGYLNRVNISVSGEYISQEFHLSQIQLGWVFSIFTLGYALFQAPTGRLADRFGPRRVLALATIWWAVFLGLTAVAPSGISAALVLLLALRFGLGMGVASIYPSSNRVVASWIPSAERGVANGWIFAGVGAGAGVAPPLITYLLLHGGWRWSFWVCAALGLAAGLVWYLLARDRPEQHPWMTPREAEHIRSGLPRVPTGPSAPKAVPWKTILGSKEVLLVSLSYFSFSYSANIFFTWFFPYLKTVRHLDLKTSAFFGMLPFLAMAIGSPLGGWISDILTKHYGRRTGRCGVAVACMGLSALFIALGTLVDDARLASIVLAAAPAPCIFPRVFLVGDRRHRRPFRRNRFRRDEYARTIWRCGGPFSHSVDGQALRLAGGVPDGRGPGRDGISRLAGGESRADAASGTRGGAR